MAFFIRFLFALLIIYPSIGHAQSVINCSTCDPLILSKEIPAQVHPSQQYIIFKCRTQVADLPSYSKWGVVDAKGKILLKPIWDSIGTVHNELAEVFQYVPQRKKAVLKAGLISFQQQLKLPLSYRSIQHVSNEFYKINTGIGYLIWHSNKGFISSKPYDSIVNSSLGILLYTEGFCHRLDNATTSIVKGAIRGWHINDNHRVYPVFYDTLFIYRNGMKTLIALAADSIEGAIQPNVIIVYRNNQKVLYQLYPAQESSITPKTKLHPSSLNTLQDSTLIKIKKRSKADSIVLVNDWYLYRRNNMWGYGDTLGNIGIGAQYEELRSKHNNRFAMKYKGKWGFLDNYENIILQPYYDEVGDFIHNGTWIKQGKKYNFIGLNGKLLNTNWYDNIKQTTGDNYQVEYKGKIGLVGKDGREIISCRYQQILDFGEGSCLVQTEDRKWFLMNYSEYRISNDPYSNVKYIKHNKVYVLKK